ncbi:hypothetical protein FB480_101901 [Agrobacterium vitis]|nr:hypothetical protein FB480_101901 [Agrobacterium vitis]
MADRPILFSAPMVRALLEGRKTQTRRALKPQPFIDNMGNFCSTDRFGKVWNWGQEIYPPRTPCTRNYIESEVRISIADRLWVKEAHAIVPRLAYRMSIGTGTIAQTEHPSDGYSAALFRECFDRSGRPPWRSSIFMPRWASRLTLIVTDVRVERLQSISEADAVAEGCQPDDESLNPNHIGPARSIYEQLWDDINGPGAWESNPWVAAYTFRVIQSNIDKVAA